MRPSGNALILVLILTIAAAVLPFFNGFILIWKTGAALVVALLIFDFFFIVKNINIEFKRELKQSISVGVLSKVDLIFKNKQKFDLSIIIHDYYPKNSKIDFFPLKAILPSEHEFVTTYDFLPLKRGNMQFKGIDIIILSRFGLWWKKHFIKDVDKIKVFPNFREIKKYALLATDNRLSQIGIKQKQRRGQGNDFHQLREYRSGDSFRQIEWNATSKYLKLISKEYQDERDQQIVFLLDCGRRMRHAEDQQSGGKQSHLDQALNAMLLLSYVASRQDDAVGFMTFGGNDKWYPPQKGGKTIRNILNQVYDIKSSVSAADYHVTAEKLLALQKRRALVILVTNTRNEDHEDLKKAVQMLKKRHLTILADLREEILDKSLQETVTDYETALRFQAVSAYLEDRKRNHKFLSHQGIVTLDLLANQLPAALVNNYLMIKASAKL
ncbi:MAG: DUF58 domain-containing protein [Desulfobacterales bacterium]|nr:DUF58 domain-containing protein [Desulfobacterales bacterium]